jgi:hypothetical protein
MNVNVHTVAPFLNIRNQDLMGNFMIFQYQTMTESSLVASIILKARYQFHTVTGTWFYIPQNIKTNSS